MIMVITSDSGLCPASARTLPLGLTSLTRSTEMLDVEMRARAQTLPYNSLNNGDIPMFSRNIPSAFSVSYSSDKEEISFSKRYQKSLISLHTHAGLTHFCSAL